MRSRKPDLNNCFGVEQSGKDRRRSDEESGHCGLVREYAFAASGAVVRAQVVYVLNCDGDSAHKPYKQNGHSHSGGG